MIYCKGGNIMKYVIVHKQDELKLVNYNVKMNGLDVVPKNKVPGLTIKSNKMLIIDKDLQDSYIREKVNRKIDKIIKFMVRILNDDGTTEDDTGMVLDELNRLKGIIINKYRDYMTKEEYKSLLTKLILIEEEFKKNYNQKLYNDYVNSYYVEEITSSRGR